MPFRSTVCSVVSRQIFGEKAIYRRGLGNDQSPDDFRKETKFGYKADIMFFCRSETARRTINILSRNNSLQEKEKLVGSSRRQDAKTQLPENLLPKLPEGIRQSQKHYKKFDWHSSYLLLVRASVSVTNFQIIKVLYYIVLRRQCPQILSSCNITGRWREIT